MTGVIVILIPFWLPVLLRGLGYYVNTPGWKAAMAIIEKERPAKDCRKILIMPWRIFSPNTSDQRMSCVHEYAELKKDPSACELIMPSEYGLSCISNTVTAEFENHADDGFFPYEECVDMSEDNIRQDWCKYLKATRSRETSFCESIKNSVLKKACILKFEAWEKYPQLRGSSYFGTAASGSSAIKTAE